MKWWLVWLKDVGLDYLDEGVVSLEEPPAERPTETVQVGMTFYEAYIKKKGNETELTVCFWTPGTEKRCISYAFSPDDVRIWEFKAQIERAMDIVLNEVRKCENADMINSNLQYALWELEKLGTFLLNKPEEWYSPEKIERRINRHWSEYESSLEAALRWAEGCNISRALEEVYRIADAVKRMVRSLRKKLGVVK